MAYTNPTPITNLKSVTANYPTYNKEVYNLFIHNYTPYRYGSRQ